MIAGSFDHIGAKTARDQGPAAEGWPARNRHDVALSRIGPARCHIVPVRSGHAAGATVLLGAGVVRGVPVSVMRHRRRGRHPPSAATPAETSNPKPGPDPGVPATRPPRSAIRLARSADGVAHSARQCLTRPAGTVIII